MDKTQATDDSLIKDKHCDTKNSVFCKKRPNDAITKSDDADFDRRCKRNPIQQIGKNTVSENGNTEPSNVTLGEEDRVMKRYEKHLSNDDRNGKHEQNSKSSHISCDDKDVSNPEYTGNRNSDQDNFASLSATFGKDYKIKERDEKQISNADDNDKLEDYLENIYIRECKFSCDDEDVLFIESGVKEFVDRIVRMRFSKLKCRRTYCNVKHNDPELLTVGSYYEHTKNKFPNEFDYIYVYGTVEDLPEASVFDHTFCDDLVDMDTTQIENGSLSLSFHGFLGCQGPAETYRFCFKKGDVEETITVDISTALRYIYTTEIHEHQNIVQESKVFRPEFYKAILDTKSFLLLDFGNERSINSHKTLPLKVCVTETELTFFKHNLSEKHKKVYKILKYLINGNFGSNLLRGINTFFSICISSYSIKTAVLYHHFKCKNESSTVSDCVLEILKDLHYTISTSRVDCFGMSPALIGAMPETLIQFSVSRVETILLVFVDFPGVCSENRVRYTTRTNTTPLVSASERDITSISNVFCLFIERLKALKCPLNFRKCNHVENDSFLEMLLKCPAIYNLAEPSFTKISDYVEECIKNKKPIVENKYLYKWLKTKKIDNCSWCNYSSSSLNGLCLEALVGNNSVRVINAEAVVCTDPP
ncbi:uncharacterized protein LOC128555196 [Mercenaria mercenaria]|uniref:uncharacterized protein LOC128555196 n=1 Tax=Mercenaria mercenaria TaxID=6596 RepID=UPI00234E662F|nr:uncharacterized protein LOC128555196 [Mercenaria mercenaria]